MAIYSLNKPGVIISKRSWVFLSPCGSLSSAYREILRSGYQYKNIGLPSTLRTLGRYSSASYSSSTSTRFKPLVIVLMGTCV